MAHVELAAALARRGGAGDGLVVADVAFAHGVAAVRRKAAELALGALGHGRVQGDEVVLVAAARARPAAELVALKAALLLGPAVARDLLEGDEHVLARALVRRRGSVGALGRARGAARSTPRGT